MARPKNSWFAVDTATSHVRSIAAYPSRESSPPSATTRSPARRAHRSNDSRASSCAAPATASSNGTPSAASASIAAKNASGSLSWSQRCGHTTRGTLPRTSGAASNGAASNGGGSTTERSRIRGTTRAGLWSGKRFRKRGISARKLSRLYAELKTQTSAASAERMLMSGYVKSQSRS